MIRNENQLSINLPVSEYRINIGVNKNSILQPHACKHWQSTDIC